MTDAEKKRLIGVLQTLSTVSYTSLIEVKRLTNVNEDQISKIEDQQNILDDLISNIFKE